jgi:hypothetical protein
MEHVGTVFGGPVVTITLIAAVLGTVLFFVIRHFFSKRAKNHRKEQGDTYYIPSPKDANSTTVRPETVLQPAESVGSVKPTGKYRAMIITNEGITFGGIDKPVGRPFFLDPSMPHTGAHYVVARNEKGEYEPYDPRTQAIDNKASPARCYKATHVYDLVKALFANKYGIWDKINWFFAAAAILLMFFVIMTAIDKIG